MPNRSQRNLAHVTTVILSWRVHNFVVIGRVYFEPEHRIFWSNFEFDRNTVSGRSLVTNKDLNKIRKFPITKCIWKWGPFLFAFPLMQDGCLYVNDKSEKTSWNLCELWQPFVGRINQQWKQTHAYITYIMDKSDSLTQRTRTSEGLVFT